MNQGIRVRAFGACRTMVQWALGLASAAACSDPAVVPSVDSGPTRQQVDPLECASPTEAPVPSGRRQPDVECLPVGASPTGPGDAWPTPAAGSAFVPPLRYVSTEGAASADGTTPERAMRDLRIAIESLGGSGGTVLLSRGTHEIAAPLRIRGPVTVVGLGAGGASSVLLAQAESTAIMVEGGGTLTARHIVLTHAERPSTPATGDPGPGMIDVARGGAAAVEDVAIVNPSVGIRVVGGTLRAARLTIRDARDDGLDLLGGGRSVLLRVLVRGAGGRGVFVENAHLILRESYVRGGAGVGVAVVGSGPTGTGATSCVLGDARFDGGSLDCLERVAIDGNASAGLYVAGNDGSAPTLEVRRIAILSTLPVTNGGSRSGGDGIFVGLRATLRMDQELSAVGSLGRGSAIIANARTGVLVSGGTIRMAGALVASNGGPGVFLQSSATADEIGYSLLTANTGVGLGATPTTRIDAITCNGIADTRLADIPTTLGMLRIGDAISVAAESGSPMRAIAVRENTISGSDRFAIVLSGSLRASVTDNRGMNNHFGLQAYDGALLAENRNNALDERARPPVANPGLASGAPR